MSARARWASGIGAVVVGGLLASIPVFLPSPAAGRDASYGWLERLSPGAVIGTAPDEQRLRVLQVGRRALCLRFGSSGRECAAVETTKQIQLVARVRGEDGNVLWGLLADDVARIRVLRSDGTVASREASRGFGVVEPRGEEIAEISAFDTSGRRVGKVPGNAFLPIACALTSCVTIDVS